MEDNRIVISVGDLVWVELPGREELTGRIIAKFYRDQFGHYFTAAYNVETDSGILEWVPFHLVTLI